MDFFGRSAPSEVQLLSAHGPGGAHRWAAHGRRRAEPAEFGKRFFCLVDLMAI